MTEYAKLEKEVDAVSDTIWDVASKVWEFAELSYKEVQSSPYVAATLKKNGFAISDKGIGGLDTSWIATWGSGSPVLGILIEFDALPGLGNNWMVLLKATALVSIIGLSDLVKAVQSAGKTSGEPFQFLLLAGVVYLLITSLSNLVLRRLERHYNTGVKELAP